MLDVVFLGANGSIQENGSLNTSLLFSDGNVYVLADASSDIFKACEAGVDAVFLTHNHIDHMYALPSLLHQSWLGGRQKKLDIICPPSVEDTIEKLMSVFSLRQKKNMFEINIIPYGCHRYGNMVFSCFKTDHTDDSFGMTVSCENKKIVYTSDTRPISNPSEDWTGADILIHESSGLFEEEETLIRKGHSSAKDASLLAQKIKAAKLILCHLPKGDDAKKMILEEARALFKESYLPDIKK